MAESFECPICQGVLQVPYECPGCHRNFCQEHINQIGRCPLCHRQNMPYEYRHNYSLEQKINEYPFTCSKGCGFKSNNIMELERHVAQCNGFSSPAFSLSSRAYNAYWNQGGQANYQYGSTNIYGDIYSNNVYTPTQIYGALNYNYSSNDYSNVIYGGNGSNTYYPKKNPKIYMSPVRNYNGISTIIPARSTNIKRIVPIPTVNITTSNSSRLNTVISSPRVIKLNRRNIARPMSVNQRRILSPVPVRSRVVGRALSRPVTLSVIR